MPLSERRIIGTYIKENNSGPFEEKCKTPFRKYQAGRAIKMAKKCSFSSCRWFGGDPEKELLKDGGG